MKKIVPFKKGLFFKENIEEITSISLEQSLRPSNNNMIVGEFFINGEYKVTNQTEIIDKFEFTIPVEIAVDEKYDLENVVIDIDDFYYEIFDVNVLSINIEVLLDKIEEKEEVREEIFNMLEEEIINSNEEIKLEEKENIKEDVFENPTINHPELNPIMLNDIEEIELEKNTSTEENEYNTYKVYIINEGDSIDTVINNYNTTREKLELYNNIEIINIGDKIIIPTND